MHFAKSTLQIEGLFCKIHHFIEFIGKKEPIFVK